MQGYIHKLAIKELGKSDGDLSPFFNITNSILFEDQYSSKINNYVGDYQNFDLYINQFYKELEASGILKVRPKQINIKLKALDESKNTYHVHGYSTGYKNDDIVDITINKRSWNTFSKAQKYSMIHWVIFFFQKRI